MESAVVAVHQQLEHVLRHSQYVLVLLDSNDLNRGQQAMWIMVE